MREPVSVSLARRILFLCVSLAVLIFAFRPYIASLNVWRGGQYMMNGRYEEGIKAIEKASMLEPNNPRVHAILGWLYSRTGRKDSAVKFYRKAIALDPRDAENRFDLGMILFEKKKYDLALDEFSKAVSYQRDNSNARIMVALSLERKGKSEMALKEWIAIERDFPRVRSASGHIERLKQELQVTGNE